MKKFLKFVAGCLTGAAVVGGVFYFLNKNAQHDTEDMDLDDFDFPEDGESNRTYVTLEKEAASAAEEAAKEAESAQN